MHCLLLSPSPVLVDLFSYTDLKTSSPLSREKLQNSSAGLHFRLLLFYFIVLICVSSVSSPQLWSD